MSKTLTTIYVTKYALSGGIRQTEAEVFADGHAKEASSSWAHNFLSPSAYTLTREDAIARAEEMRVKKLASLKKQIAKLEKLDLTKIKGESQ